MIKILLILQLLFLHLYAMEIDHKTLQNIIADNPDAYKEKILLAKYYMKRDNNLKALTLLDEVLEKQPKNETALYIKKHIAKKEKNSAVFREAGLKKPIKATEAQKRLESYYSANNYQFYSNLYQALLYTNIHLEDKYHIKAAYIYLWDTRYKSSENALMELRHENNIDAAKIRADICYYRGKYRCAAKLFDKLYNSSATLDYAIKLIYSNIYIGETQKAQRLYNFLYRKHPKSNELAKIGKKLSSSKNNYLLNMQKAYKQNKNVKTLTAYATALYSDNKQNETITLIHKFNKEHATHESLLLEAKYLIWGNHTKKALAILKRGSLNNDLDAKFMLGQIYSWNQQFKESKKNLNEVIVKTKNKNLLFDAKKSRAYVYMWEKESAQAEKLFKELQKERPKDKEIREALMELRHDYTGLIKIYKKRVKKSSKLSDMKRLGELYIHNKQSDKARQYLSKYIQKNPNDLESTKTLALLLIENKKYYQGFGYLEYYAAQKRTSDASILLAKNYYWQGFSKEALDVLNSLLKKKPRNKEALKLKASILKISPRFTTSNSGATTSMFFNDLGKKQLFLADTLYFNGHYKASLAYFRDYLQTHPNDHEARYRYAFALEYAKEYGKAEGEFSLIFWTKDSDELRYHYAYNMMKNGKLKKAKEILLKLKKSTYNTIDPHLNTFVTSWKKAWQSQKFSNYATHYDRTFTADKLWSYRKQQKFADVTYISIALFDPISKKVDDHNYIVKFYQEYSTNRSSDKGYKTLYLKCDNTELECKITKESWEAGVYKKTPLLMPYIERSLKDIEYYKKHPLALNTKKKTLWQKQNLQNIMT